MAITVRYFDDTAAGAGDGTTWADRAALYTGGAWSTVITGHDFTSDSLECRLGINAVATVGALLQASSFTSTAPTLSKPLFIVAWDDGAADYWEPADFGWYSAEPWDDTDQPEIATTTNVQTVSLSGSHFYGIKFTGTARNGMLTNAGNYYWCLWENSQTNASAGGVSNPVNIMNCCVRLTGTNFVEGINFSTATGLPAHNVRIELNSSASSGDRRGVTFASNSNLTLDMFTILGAVGTGIAMTSTGANAALKLTNSVIYGGGADGILGSQTINQTLPWLIEQSVIVENGGWALNVTSSTPALVVIGCRMRDNTSGNFDADITNMPTTLGNDVSAGTNADEFVNVSGAVSTWDLRIKNTSSKWGKSYGVADQPAAGGSSAFAFASIG